MLRLCIFIGLLIFSLTTAANTEDQVKSHSLVSQALADNLIKLESTRKIKVYLPPNYHKQQKRYPVIYYIPFHPLPDDTKIISLLKDAFYEKRIKEFIFVSGDFSIPNTINFFGNGPTTGRWLDHIREEIVPFIDKHYRTLAQPSSRGISGHFLGGYAALRLAMFHPDIFGSVYGLHPVGTDTGEKSMLYIPDWREIHTAKSMSELKAPYSFPFVAMAQAHLPNPKNPPFYADFIVELIDDKLTPNQANIRKLLDNFHLANMVNSNAENIGQLRGIKFDWGRDDMNQSHVYGARKFSLLLKDYGISHEAEEYNGDGWNYEFDKEGRIYQDLLTFFNRHIEFE
jgi:Tfp pilus assembly protein PilP